ncbi:tryptophan synthase alpha chain [Pullulanibacillus pueri]|uniref:Tryptophan synthase alpha chain n=1 Tax=Pullulanibacillus pueri TaxID=1437324 RepID=A0A8J2ZUJ0_9BACL|nr:tryptophan synthase subunit alpha [Pullulanibacillus pueri]MBM7681457.1 tryptophan synthase alpha chain [Pullulanibacillus pueri]GGH78954.1 tryptophan synthase alpha chain [Pullulanibacillus pueri]
MSRLSKTVSASDKMHFIPFITAGDPNIETTIDLALMLQDMGASVLELGIPFSDPLADGPVIQRASLRALAGGMTLSKAMDIVPKMREKGLKIPVIIFTYYNLLLQLGENNFIKKAIENEIDGLLVPDLPYEESAALRSQCREHHLALISLVAPTTSQERLERIGKDSDGFLYCVSSLGVTGVRKTFHPHVLSFLQRVQKASEIPVAVGFGISSKEQVQQLKDYCEGYVVGSAIVREIESREDRLQSAERDQAIEEIRETLSQKLLF